MSRFPITDTHFKKSIKGIDVKPLIPQRDYFNYLIRSVAYQQLSGKAAATIYGRFSDLFPLGKPSAGLILEKSVAELRTIGLSGQKSTYIQHIAAFALKNDFSDTYLDRLSDEEVVKYLTQIKGVGKWTVEMLLIFAMDRPDVFPIDDFGIRSGIQLMYNLDANLPKKEMNRQLLQISETWKPHRSLATRYIWAWKDRYTALMRNKK